MTKTERAFANTTRPRFAARLRIALVVAVFGIVVTVSVYSWQRHRDQRANYLAFTRHAQSLSAQIQRGVELPLEAVRALPHFFAASEHVTRHDFSAFVAPILRRHRNVSYIEWAPYVENRNRAAFEQRARETEWPEFAIIEPAADGAMVPALRRPYYMPLLHAVSLDPVRPLIGLDIGFDAPRRARNEHALLEHSIDISPRFTLVEDPPDVGSIAILIPSESPQISVEPHVPRRGITILIFRVEATIRATLPPPLLDDVDLLIVDESATQGDERVIFESRPGLAHAQETHADDFWSTSFSYYSRTWSTHFTRKVTRDGATPLSLALLALGIALSLLAAVATLLLGTVNALRKEVDVAKQLGQYRLVRKLGEGGMGVVYEAEHALLRRPTAIKVLLERAIGTEGVQRFEREVHATSHLTHPNTVSIFDFGRTADGVFYYAMEYIDGVTLEHLVRDVGPLPPARVVHLLKQMCGSLQEAHVAGLVHRDIKPSNVMVCERGGIADFVKVLDFGLVKHLVEDKDAKLSDAQRLLGTPQYMAPEALLRSRDVGPALDIYALGCVGYFMLTATEVFRGPTVASVVAHHLHEAPESPSKRVGRTIPGALEQLVLSCLAKDPNARPDSAEAVAEALSAMVLSDAWTQTDARQSWETYRARRATDSEAPKADPSQDTLAVDLQTRAQ